MIFLQDISDMVEEIIPQEDAEHHLSIEQVCNLFRNFSPKDRHLTVRDFTFYQFHQPKLVICLACGIRRWQCMNCGQELDRAETMPRRLKDGIWKLSVNGAAEKSSGTKDFTM